MNRIASQNTENIKNDSDLAKGQTIFDFKSLALRIRSYVFVAIAVPLFYIVATVSLVFFC